MNAYLGRIGSIKNMPYECVIKDHTSLSLPGRALPVELNNINTSFMSVLCVSL